MTILALVVAAWAFLTALAATFTFIHAGPVPPREIAIGVHALAAIPWALATPFCCWGVLRGGRRAVWGTAIWLGLVGLCQWWWWPGPLTERPERAVEPLWYGGTGLISWALVAASLGVGLIAASRHRRPTVRKGGIAAVCALVVIAGLSYWNLERHARADESTPFAEGPVSSRL